MSQSTNYAISDPDEVMNLALVTRPQGDTHKRRGAETASESRGIPSDIEGVEQQAQDSESECEKTLLVGTDEIAVYIQRLKALSATNPEETIRIDMTTILAHRSEARKAVEEVKIQKVETQKAQNAPWPVIAIAVGFMLAGVFLLLTWSFR